MAKKRADKATPGATSHETSQKTTQKTSDKASQKTQTSRVFDMIERLGNKLPDPFVLFIVLALIVIGLSAVANALGASAEHPQTGDDEAVRSLLSGEGIQFMLTSMLENFTGFAPLGLVLGIMLGIGLVEQVGYLDYAIRKSVSRVPGYLLPYMAVFVGIMGNIASDAAMVLIPPLMAMAFYKIGRHPIAGLVAGFAGAGAGFTANLMVAGTDALLAGITTEAARIVDDSVTVSPVANWYFNIVCVFVLTLVGGLITTRITERRLGTYDGDAVELEDDRAPTRREHKGFLLATGAGLLYVALIAVAVLIPGSPLQGEDGAVIESPFMDGIVPLILIFFIVIGVTYGIIVGKIKNTGDVSKHMAAAMATMGTYIVMVFAIAQFIEYFNWSNLGLWVAVSGAEFLERVGFTGVLLILTYSLFTVLLNLLVTSGSAQWALQAPIFVPMLMQLGYHPGFIQAAYRIGDSSTNIVTPLFPFMPVILAYMQKYDKKAGIGTYISLMLPYAVGFFIAFNIVLYVFFFLGIPFGPGVPVYLE